MRSWWWWWSSSWLCFSLTSDALSTGKSTACKFEKRRSGGSSEWAAAAAQAKASGVNWSLAERWAKAESERILHQLQIDLGSCKNCRRNCWWLEGRVGEWELHGCGCGPRQGPWHKLISSCAKGSVFGKQCEELRLKGVGIWPFLQSSVIGSPRLCCSGSHWAWPLLATWAFLPVCVCGGTSVLALLALCLAHHRWWALSRRCRSIVRGVEMAEEYLDQNKEVPDKEMLACAQNLEGLEARLVMKANFKAAWAEFGRLPHLERLNLEDLCQFDWYGWWRSRGSVPPKTIPNLLHWYSYERLRSLGLAGYFAIGEREKEEYTTLDPSGVPSALFGTPDNGLLFPERSNNSTASLCNATGGRCSSELTLETGAQKLKLTSNTARPILGVGPPYSNHSPPSPSNPSSI